MARELYPRPEFVRDNWTNLNGEWEFELDTGVSAKSRGRLSAEHLDGKINVPFCPESELSGVGHRDFINACVYKRNIVVHPEAGKKYLLNFEAAYHTTEVYIGDEPAGGHKGGYTPFTVDMTPYLTDGENTITVYCRGDSRDHTQPSGKQSERYESQGCMYTRTTGIFAPVWSEVVPATYVKAIKLDPDTDNSRLFADIKLCGKGKKTVRLTAMLGGKQVGVATAETTSENVRTVIDIDTLKLWSPANPTLYDLIIQLDSADGTDTVKSYFGMRKIEMDGECMLINGKRFYQKLVLDQGYYGKGVYTAENDDDFEKDIRRSMRLGFNGARLHERVFERRFLYDADRLGYVVWGEYPNWGFDHTSETALKYYLPEWLEAIDRDYNHPALIGWCTTNETWDQHGCQQDNEFLRQLYYATKRADTMRPCIDVSGNYHVITDIYDIHDYNQDTAALHRRYDSLLPGEIFENKGDRQKYGGEPYMISEYGGIRWTKDVLSEKSEKSWGYGDSPKSLDEYIARYTEMAHILISCPRICGLCYTQLYDVEQEQNGLYYYDREPKFSEEVMDKLAEAMNEKSAIEND